MGLAINPAGTFAYVTNNVVPSGTVKKIDLATDTVVATIAVGSAPSGVVVDPAGTFAYVGNSYSGTVSKINLATDTVVSTITVGDGVKSLAINPAGTFAFVANQTSGTVSKINLATDTVATTIVVGPDTRGVAVNPAGTFAYVANGVSSVSKINLATDRISTSVTAGATPTGLAINPAGTFAYVVNAGGGALGTVSKISTTATDSQSIAFTSVASQLLGAKTVAISATASSVLAVTFSSSTPNVCTVTGSTVTMVTLGSCTINANQAGGSGWDAAPQVSRTFAILPSPPSGEPGISINGGASYTNTKSVTLNLVWPEFATEARISNDGGFAASATSTVPLAATVKWDLDDSVKGVYTKVVYVRFSGVGDQSKSYTDDIILDTTAPAVETPSATAASGSIEVSLKATDDISGVDKVEVKNGTTSVVKAYESKVSVTEKELGLAVTTANVRKSNSSSIEVRVSDKAGNWSSYQTLAVNRAGSSTVNTPTVVTPTVVAPKVVAPKVTTSKSVTAKSIATFAKLTVLSTSKVTLKVISGYSKFCKVSGSSLKGLKVGTCKVTITVTPKKGKLTSKTVSLKVTK
jgi:YVTN family beta-propeller protein